MAQAWRGHGAGVARAMGNFWLGWRGRGAAWRGRGAGMSCDPWEPPLGGKIRGGRKLSNAAARIPADLGGSQAHGTQGF
eukprot:gene22355-biopygen13272